MTQHSAFTVRSKVPILELPGELTRHEEFWAPVQLPRNPHAQERQPKKLTVQILPFIEMKSQLVQSQALTGPGFCFLWFETL